MEVVEIEYYMGLRGYNILVTGGTGFAGSHLVDELVSSGNSVYTTAQRHNPFSYFITQKLQTKVTMADIDIGDFNAVHDIISRSHIDYIFHLAAQPLVDVAYLNPMRTLYTNILGTINVLESARQLGTVKGIIVASSDKAYGKKIKKFSAYDEDDPLKGDHPYEVSKSSTDLICFSYFKTYGLPVIITRFGNIYGEGDLNFSRIIPGAMKAILKNEILEIRSDGSYYRDYLYVKDVVRGYIMLAETIDRYAGEVFNFGSEENISVLDLIEVIQKILRKELNYKILNTAKNEIPYQSLNYKKVLKSVGWSPEYSLKSTLPSILSWYEKYFRRTG